MEMSILNLPTLRLITTVFTNKAFLSFPAETSGMEKESKNDYGLELIINDI